MGNYTLMANKEDTVKILLNEFDGFKPASWEVGGRFASEAAFLFERSLFEDFLNVILKTTDLIRLEWADYFIHAKELYYFDEIDADDLEDKKADALFVCEKRKLMIMSF